MWRPSCSARWVAVRPESPCARPSARDATAWRNSSCWSRCWSAHWPESWGPCSRPRCSACSSSHCRLARSPRPPALDWTVFWTAILVALPAAAAHCAGPGHHAVAGKSAVDDGHHAYGRCLHPGRSPGGRSGGGADRARRAAVGRGGPAASFRRQPARHHPGARRARGGRSGCDRADAVDRRRAPARVPGSAAAPAGIARCSRRGRNAEATVTRAGRQLGPVDCGAPGSRMAPRPSYAWSPPTTSGRSGLPCDAAAAFSAPTA